MHFLKSRLLHLKQVASLFGSDSKLAKNFLVEDFNLGFLFTVRLVWHVYVVLHPAQGFFFFPLDAYPSFKLSLPKDDVKDTKVISFWTD